MQNPASDRESEQCLWHVLFKWFKEKTCQYNPISWHIIIRSAFSFAKAEDFATKLGDFNFKPNASWLDRFKFIRHGIICRSVCGEKQKKHGVPKAESTNFYEGKLV